MKRWLPVLVLSLLVACTKTHVVEKYRVIDCIYYDDIMVLELDPKVGAPSGSMSIELDDDGVTFRNADLYYAKSTLDLGDSFWFRKGLVLVFVESGIVYRQVFLMDNDQCSVAHLKRVQYLSWIPAKSQTDGSQE